MSSEDRASYRRRTEDYGSSGGRSGFYSDDTAARERAERERAERLKEARRTIRDDPPPPPREERRRAEEERERTLYDADFVRNRITVPPSEARHAHIVLVDNSGSNRMIAEHFRASTGYALANFGAIDPDGAVATRYFSDHCDGTDLAQDVDYVLASKPDAEKALYSGTRAVHGASGGDEAEAIECILHEACDLDFAHVQVPDRHLYLVTDVVAHGMGLRSDNGCPQGRKWQDSVARVVDTFGTFQLVGCNDMANMGKLQEQFLAAERRAWDLLDLSEIRSQEHRLAISLNSLLFLMARNMGEQVARVFLMSLYEKWLREPIFGQDTDLRAREAIRRFMKFLEITPEARTEMEERLFAV